MTLGVGNIVALVCLVISIIFALVTHEATNPLWWALLAIFAVLWWGSKVAFAVYLRERGYPAAVILDDALVHADDHRFERMQTALRKAGETIQVLILTCRQRDWSNFGAPIRRLADGKVM